MSGKGSFKSLFRSKSGQETAVFDDNVDQASGVVALYSWGVNSHAQLGHSQATGEGNSDLFVDTSEVTGKPIVTVACGPTHTVALTNDYQLLGCGDNSEGQLQPNRKDVKTLQKLTNINLPTISKDPTSLSNPANQIVQVSCGRGFTAYLTSVGRVYTYGENKFGQLGHSSDRDVRLLGPRMVEGIPHEVCVFVCCGEYSTYVLSKHGKVYSCGFGKDGRLGLGYYTAEQLNKNFLDTGSLNETGKSSQAKNLRSSKLKSDEFSPIDIQKHFSATDLSTFQQNSHEMREVGGPLKGTPVVQLAAGKAHCLAVTVSGRVYAWGSNSKGQLGIELSSNSTRKGGKLEGEAQLEAEFNHNFMPVPTLVPILEKEEAKSLNARMVQCAAGDEHSLFLNADKKVIYGCGSNEHGQLGLGSSVPYVNRVTKVANFSVDLKGAGKSDTNLTNKVMKLGCGASHSVLLFESGKVAVIGKHHEVKDNSAQVISEHVSEKTKMSLVSCDDVFDIGCGGDSTFLLRSDQYSELLKQKVKKGTVLVDMLPIGIDAARVRKLSKNPKVSGKQLFAKLQTVLFEMHTLNASFLSLDSQANTHLSKFQSSCLDIEGMLETLRLFQSMLTRKEDKLKIRALFSSLVAKMNRSAPYVTDPDQLRAYFLLILSPLMPEVAPSEHEILFISIFKLPIVSRRRIFSWMYDDILAPDAKDPMGLNSRAKLSMFLKLFVQPLLKYLDQHIKNRKYTNQAVVICKFLHCLHVICTKRETISSTEFYTVVPDSFTEDILRQMYRRWRAVVNKGVFQEEESRRLRMQNQLQRRMFSPLGMFGPFGGMGMFGAGLDMMEEDELNDFEDGGIRRMNSNPSVVTHESDEHDALEQFDITGKTFGLEVFGAELLLLVDDQHVDELVSNSPEFVLFKHPFLLSADIKRRFMKIDDEEQQQRNAIQGVMSDGSPMYFLEIRRDHMFQDAVEALRTAMIKPSTLRRPLRIKFKGEEGLDAGGVKKEFFLLLSQDLFNPNFGHFKEISRTHLLWFNNSLDVGKLPDKEDITYQEYLKCVNDYDQNELNMFKVIGLMMGLAVYNDTLLDVQFPPAMYQILLKQFEPTSLSLDEYKRFDPEAAKHLEFVKGLTDPEDIESLSLTFAITEDFYGIRKSIELCEGGNDKALTMNNRDEYIKLYIQYCMYSKLIEKKSTQLMKGFNLIIPSGQAALRLFRPDEMELLLCGSRELDFELLEKNCEYEGGYTKNSRAVKNFWKIVRELTYEDKQYLLKFSTGSSRAPVGGLKNIKYKIQRAGPDSEQLPTSHTCFNTLMLPDYNSYEKMKRLLLIAIENSEGFGLE